MPPLSGVHGTHCINYFRWRDCTAPGPPPASPSSSPSEWGVGVGSQTSKSESVDSVTGEPFPIVPEYNGAPPPPQFGEYQPLDPNDFDLDRPLRSHQLLDLGRPLALDSSVSGVAMPFTAANAMHVRGGGPSHRVMPQQATSHQGTTNEAAEHQVAQESLSSHLLQGQAHPPSQPQEPDDSSAMPLPDPSPMHVESEVAGHQVVGLTAPQTVEQQLTSQPLRSQKVADQRVEDHQVAGHQAAGHQVEKHPVVRGFLIDPPLQSVDAKPALAKTARTRPLLRVQIPLGPRMRDASPRVSNAAQMLNGDQMGRLFDSNLLYDVLFRPIDPPNQSDICAHKTILASKSEWFRNIFEVDGTDLKVFETGEVRDILYGFVSIIYRQPYEVARDWKQAPLLFHTRVYLQGMWRAASDVKAASVLRITMYPHEQILSEDFSMTIDTLKNFLTDDSEGQDIVEAFARLVLHNTQCVSSHNAKVGRHEDKISFNALNHSKRFPRILETAHLSLQLFSEGLKHDLRLAHDLRRTGLCWCLSCMSEYQVDMKLVEVKGVETLSCMLCGSKGTRFKEQVKPDGPNGH